MYRIQNADGRFVTGATARQALHRSRVLLGGPLDLDHDATERLLLEKIRERRECVPPENRGLFAEIRAKYVLNAAKECGLLEVTKT